MPAVVMIGGGPAPYATTYLPLFTYRNAFEFPAQRVRRVRDVIMFPMTFVIVHLQAGLARRWRNAFIV